IGSNRSRWKIERLATLNRSARNDFLTTATNTFFISRRPDGSRSIDSQSEFRIKTRATSLVGRTPAEVICDAAVTPGLFLTKQSRAVKRNARIRRRFQFSWRNGA